LAGALGQVPFGQGLQAPGDAPDKPELIADPCLLAEQFDVAGAQAGDGELPKGSEFVSQVRIHGLLLFAW
jgi:hypothetical protein